MKVRLRNTEGEYEKEEFNGIDSEDEEFFELNDITVTFNTDDPKVTKVIGEITIINKYIGVTAAKVLKCMSGKHSWTLNGIRETIKQLRYEIEDLMEKHNEN